MIQLPSQNSYSGIDALRKNLKLFESSQKYLNTFIESAHNNFTTNVSLFKLRHQVLQSCHMLMLWCIINIPLRLRDCEAEGKLNIYVLGQ